MERAIIATNEIQAKTKLFEIPVSIMKAAEQIAREIHGDLSSCISLFIGPGKMAEILVRHFQESNLGKIIETKIINFEDIKEFLSEDIRKIVSISGFN